jgi:Uma2 family endonuclease
MAEQCAVLDGCESHWLIPTACGYIAADLDIISGLPRHTELIDGSLVVAGRQTLFHMRMLRLLEGELDSQASERFAIQRGMTVMLDPKQRPEPDIMIVWASAEVSLDQTDFKPEDVLLVAEVVSSESCVRDRVRKPQLYAKAGFRVFWRIEGENGRPVVYTFELDPGTKNYAPTGIHRGLLTASWPFPIDIDLDAIELPGQ